MIFMLLMSGMTSFMYFFVHFSIDGNLSDLMKKATLNEVEVDYRQALISNVSLARSMLIGFTLLTLFVYGLFYYRFFKSQKRTLGCIKQLGYSDRHLKSIFLRHTLVIHMMGAVVGLVCGYWGSDILINANQQTYGIKEIVKWIQPSTLLMGVGFPLIVLLVVTGLMYHMIQGKETSLLMSGMNQEKKFLGMIKAANGISACFPKKYQLPIRLSLRQPIANSLIWISVMMVSVMFILAYSLNVSSQCLMETQLMGRHYAYQICLDQVELTLENSSGQEVAPYLETECQIRGKNHELVWKAVGMELKPELLKLVNEKRVEIETPEAHQVVIPKQLEEIYGFKKGDFLTLSIGKKQCRLEISEVAYNGKVGYFYMNQETLADLLHVPSSAYNGLLSGEVIEVKGVHQIITEKERVELLQRNQVSNRVSAVINQVIGVVMGGMLFFLALLLNFQSCSKEIMILKGIGYENKAIFHMLINIYGPVIAIAFVVTLGPSIWIVKGILKSLSMQIGDYMMFQTNGMILLGIGVLLFVIYEAVQVFFRWGIRNITRKETFLWQYE